MCLYLERKEYQIYCFKNTDFNSTTSCSLLIGEFSISYIQSISLFPYNLTSYYPKADRFHGNSWFVRIPTVDNINTMDRKLKDIVKMLHRKLSKAYQDDTMKNFPAIKKIFTKSDNNRNTFNTIKYNYYLMKVLSFFLLPARDHMCLEIYVSLSGVNTMVMSMFFL